MAIIYTYPTVIPEANDILLGTEVGATLRTPNKEFQNRRNCEIHY